ncbi:hypothetical protein H0H93_002156 [Arthromyces matolae]|nr:hypothetical protein H0H93_002156 [Arthromyces matolae]
MDEEKNLKFEAERVDQDYDERARKFWSLYVKESEQHDRNMTETWKASMDSTLIFAGLFSAVVTGFLIDSYKLLKADPNDKVMDLLSQTLAVQIYSASLNTSAIPLPTTVTANPSESPFNPPASAVALNILWFLSLSCSLAASLCVILVQKWIRDYLHRVEEPKQPQQRARVRGLLFFGSDKWKFEKLIAFIPSLLHISLFFFFAGLCIFLWRINKPTFAFVLVVVICCLIGYLIATMAPLLDLTAPYETPFSSILSYIHRLIVGRGLANLKMSLALLRETLGSPSDFDSKLGHEHIKALSWVYDRTNDDVELQALVESIPGLLISRDGKDAWNVFLVDNSNSLSPSELGSRTFRLLESCSSAVRYLDPTRRFMRAAVCIDALFVFSVNQDRRFELDLSRSQHIFLSDFIRHDWEDDGTLATKAACDESLLRHHSLNLEVRDMERNTSYAGLRDSAEGADRALRDLDERRKSLEGTLSNSDMSIQPHKYDDTLKDVAPLTLVVSRYVDKMKGLLPRNLPCLFWYSSLAGITSAYELKTDDNTTFKIYPEVYMLLGYLRMHKAYPGIPSLPFPVINATDPGKIWPEILTHIPLPWHTCSNPHQSGYNGAPQTLPLDSDSITFSIQRELQPLSVAMHISSIEAKLSQPQLLEPQRRMSCHLTQLITPTSGPFSLLKTILAALEEGGELRSLLVLIETLRYHRPHAKKPFIPSVIDEWFKAICPCLAKWQAPQSEGSQVLLVLALLEILTWESELSIRESFPFSDFVVQRLIGFLASLKHERPLEMAERGFGCVPDMAELDRLENETPNFSRFRFRVESVYKHVSSQRSRALKVG